MMRIYAQEIICYAKNTSSSNNNNTREICNMAHLKIARDKITA
jgi:hypothetical protein